MPLTNQLKQEIIKYAQINDIKKVILFGSRARGDNHDRSDIDLAVSGGNPSRFHGDLEECAHTLLFFDVVDLDRPSLSQALRNEINRDGELIYEEI
ncbi:MAG: nucleotidyltransferase domain-containing protein [Selenomonas sp.]|nr:nucleotidyltransferase domain-containing protein [Selenomonas sp.]